MRGALVVLLLLPVSAVGCYEKQSLLSPVRSAAADAGVGSPDLEPGRCPSVGAYRSCPFPRDQFGKLVAMAGVQVCGLDNRWQACVPKCDLDLTSSGPCFYCLLDKCPTAASNILCTDYRNLYCDRFNCGFECQKQHPGCRDLTCQAAIADCTARCEAEVVCKNYKSNDCDLTRCAQPCDESRCAPDFTQACLDEVAACKASCEARYPTPYTEAQRCAVDPSLCGWACSEASVAREAIGLCKLTPPPDAGVRLPDAGIRPADRMVAPDRPPESRVAD